MEAQKLNVYQIGLSGISRRGFEHLIEIQNHFSEVDVELVGVCDRDFEKLERAEKFAEVNGIEIETFKDVKKMYSHAKESNEKVMIYDAGTVSSRPDNIYRSMENGFFHLAEKPASMSREQHLREKKLAEENNAMWKADFIERENPVVNKLTEIINDKDIEELRVFRESSVGIEMVLDQKINASVRGGDIFDKMSDEVYILDLLEKSNNGKDKLDFEQAEAEYFMPAEINSEKLMSLEGSRTKEIQKASTAQTKALFSSGDVSIKLNSSWIGLSRDCMIEAQEISKQTNHTVYNRDFSNINGETYLKEDARFIVVEGETDFVGDLLNNKLLKLETGEEIELDEYIHDQLYRVLENAVRNAVGLKDNKTSEKETDLFINSLFDVREEVIKGNVFDEASKASEKIDSLIIEDENINEPKELREVAG